MDLINGCTKSARLAAELLTKLPTLTLPALKSHTRGFCRHVDTSCEVGGVARTCATFGKECVELSNYPNATISEYGEANGEHEMMAEIYARGPIACGIDAAPILEYTGGIASDKGGIRRSCHFRRWMT
eukprot:UN02722